MQLIYRKLFEVEIRHDYFLLPGIAVHYTTDYDIRKIFSVYPSEATVSLMRDQQMLFKRSGSGFVILVKAVLNPLTGIYHTVVDLSVAMAFTFYWKLEDPYFENFTNRRLIEAGKKIYYFSNRTGVATGGISYLNRQIAPFGTAYPPDPQYRLGDIVSEGGQTYEMIAQEAPLINFLANAAKWQSIAATVINFVNPSDRITWQDSRWTWQRPNMNPGEFIVANLFDINGLPVDTGVIMGTRKPQNEYRSSMNPAEDLNFVMDLGGIRPGLYRMDIHESSGLTQQSFYLMDRKALPGLYGVSEFFISGAPAPLTFTIQDPVSKVWQLDDPEKNFMIRFPNRRTRWKYLNQDLTVFNEPPTPRPLTQFYSAYTVPGPGGSTLNLPDPKVNQIVPDLDPVTNLVKNIFSNIFLNK